jgi:hypothetical protein
MLPLTVTPTRIRRAIRTLGASLLPSPRRARAAGAAGAAAPGAAAGPAPARVGTGSCARSTAPSRRNALHALRVGIAAVDVDDGRGTVRVFEDPR